MSDEKDSAAGSKHVFGAHQTTVLGMGIPGQQESVSSFNDSILQDLKAIDSGQVFSIVGMAGATNPDDFITYSTENAELIADSLIGVQSVMDHYRHLKERDLKMSEPLQRKFNRVIACYVVFMQQTKHTPLIKALKEFNEILQDELKTI